MEIAVVEDEKAVREYTLSSNLLPSEIQQAEQTMEQMMENINQKVWHRMEGTYEE